MSKLSIAVNVSDHLQGKLDAPGVVVQFGDYECPASSTKSRAGHAVSIDSAEKASQRGIVWRGAAGGSLGVRPWPDAPPEYGNDRAFQQNKAF
jgi:hypothetical protein